MSDNSADSVTAGLSGIEEAARKSGEKGLPPVHLWHPDYCGELDIRIARDGTWFYNGTPIGRKRLVRLFSRVLRKDPDGRTYLVTPVEKIGIVVEDVPFVAIDFEAEGKGEAQVITLRTNVGDKVTADAEHPMRLEINPGTGEPTPYVLVRAALEARVNRAMFYHLVELGVEHNVDGEAQFGLWSAGTFFPFARASELLT